MSTKFRTNFNEPKLKAEIKISNLSLSYHFSFNYPISVIFIRMPHCFGPTLKAK